MTPYLLHQLLSESATRSPDSIAVVHGGESLTYAELERRSNQLANALIDLGVSPGDHVALHTRKSVGAIVAIYGILKAGASYVPVDFTNPAARLADVVDQCGIEVVVTEAAALAKLVDAVFRATRLRVAIVVDAAAPDSDVEALSVVPFLELVGNRSGQTTKPPEIAVTDHDLAYVLFTSGSTGRPKGVMHTHRSGLTFVNWATDTFGIRSDDRLSNHAPFNFDLSIFDIFVAAKAGAALCLIPEGLAGFPVRLAELIERDQISVWYSVPSVLARFATHGMLEQRNLECLRIVLFAGEVFPVRQLRTLMTALPDVRYANLYGPTETNVCTWYEVTDVPAEDARPIPIGVACANTEVIALAEDGTRVSEVGREGLLYVRGSTVMAGYHGRPDETVAAFVENPFGPSRQESLYCTGDWVTLDERRNYLFLGRRDHMVKVGGYRIELGEVETALHAHPGVAEAVAVALPDDDLGSRIRAVVVVGDDSVDEQGLRRHCARLLPRYMVPAEIELRQSLPRTSNDKVDRARLTADAVADR